MRGKKRRAKRVFVPDNKGQFLLAHFLKIITTQRVQNTKDFSPRPIKRRDKFSEILSSGLERAKAGII